MFLDANIFIHAFYDSPGKKTDICRNLMRRISSGEQNATTSCLVIDEIAHFFIQKRGKDFALAMLRNLTENPHLSILPLDEKSLALLPEYIKLGMDASDAFHAACMRANKIDTICSYDAGFDKISSIKRQEPK